MTFGIAPTAPETGYGYIEAGAPIAGPVAAVARFVEKPDRAKAEAMLARAAIYWNSGMFMLGVGTFLDECRTLAPEMLAAAEERSQRRRPISTSSASTPSLRQGAEHLGRLRDLREDQAGRGRAGRLRLVGSRQLGCGVEGEPAHAPTATSAPAP